MAEKRTIILEVELDADGAVQDSKQLTDSLAKTGDQAEKTSSSFGALDGALGSLDDALGGLPSKAKAGVSGLKGLSGGFKGLRAAIISTGIGALIIALTSLVTFFTKTQRGIDLVSKAMAFLGGAIEPVIDLAIEIGETLVEAFTNPLAAIEQIGGILTKVFTDPIGAITDLGNATNNFFNDVVDRGSKALQIEEERQALTRLQIQDITRLANLEVELSNARLQVEDRLNNSAQERIGFLNEAERVTREIFQLQRDRLTTEIDLLARRQALGENTLEDDRALAELQRELILLDKQQADGLRELTTKRAELNNQVLQEIELENARIAQLELREEIESAGLDQRLQRKVAEDEALLETDQAAAEAQQNIQRQLQDNLIKIRQDSAKKKDAVDQAVFENDIARTEQSLEIAGQAAQAIFGDTKAGAILGTIINTAQGIVKTIANVGFPAAIPFVALTAATGAAQLATIQGQEFASGGMINAPSHSRGGRNINVEGGEAVINKRSMSNPVLRSLASAINTAGGGVPLTSPALKTRFQTGGLVEDTLLNFENQLNNAIQAAPPVLVTEDFNEVNNRVLATEAKAEL